MNEYKAVVGLILGFGFIFFGVLVSEIGVELMKVSKISVCIGAVISIVSLLILGIQNLGAMFEKSNPGDAKWDRY